MTYDWTRPRGDDVLRCYMVDPSDLDCVLGEVEMDGGSVSRGYYNDTRECATVTTRQWSDVVPGAWLRIVHEVPAWGYSRELFTGFATSAPSERYGRSATTTVTLKSSIYAMDLNAYPSVFTIGAGAMASDVLARLCGIDCRAFAFAGDFADYRFASTRSFDPGTSVASMCHSVCSAAGARMEVDGHGRVVFRRYTEPSRIEAGSTIALGDERSIVVEGSVASTDEASGVTNTAVLVYKDGDTEVVASASLPSSHAKSRAHTGVTNAAVYQLADMDEVPTVASLQQVAQGYLGGGESTEWIMTALWCELAPGDVVAFDPGDGPRRCLVKNTDATLPAMTLDVTLKEV